MRNIKEFLGFKPKAGTGQDSNLKDRQIKIVSWINEIEARINNDNGGHADADDRKRLKNLRETLSQINTGLGIRGETSNVIKATFGKRKS